MKLTTELLKKLIKEELEQISSLEENDGFIGASDPDEMWNRLSPEEKERLMKDLTDPERGNVPKDHVKPIAEGE